MPSALFRHPAEDRAQKAAGFSPLTLRCENKQDFKIAPTLLLLLSEAITSRLKTRRSLSHCLPTSAESLKGMGVETSRDFKAFSPTEVRTRQAESRLVQVPHGRGLLFGRRCLSRRGWCDSLRCHRHFADGSVVEASRHTPQLGQLQNTEAGSLQGQSSLQTRTKQLARCS